jgi:hypothetical protein
MLLSFALLRGLPNLRLPEPLASGTRRHYETAGCAKPPSTQNRPAVTSTAAIASGASSTSTTEPQRE